VAGLLILEIAIPATTGDTDLPKALLELTRIAYVWFLAEEHH
jgi:hypothetical protein